MLGGHTTLNWPGWDWRLFFVISGPHNQPPLCQLTLKLRSVNIHQDTGRELNHSQCNTQQKHFPTAGPWIWKSPNSVCGASPPRGASFLSGLVTEDQPWESGRLAGMRVMAGGVDASQTIPGLLPCLRISGHFHEGSLWLLYEINRWCLELLPGTGSFLRGQRQTCEQIKVSVLRKLKF